MIRAKDIVILSNATPKHISGNLDNTIYKVERIVGRGSNKGTAYLIDIVNKVTSKGDDLSIVGWWHSHPNIGAHIFSSTDVNTQNAYQALFDRAIAFVIDQEKFKRTADFVDLDTRFYRVDGSKSYAIPYELRGDPANEIRLILPHILMRRHLSLFQLSINQL